MAALGVLRLTLHIPESGSLKSKRQVLGGLLRRVRDEFKVSVAEVGDRDRWQLAEVAIACVNEDRDHTAEVLSKVLTFVERSAQGAVVSDVATEFLSL
ncbi:MAG TPA: DUF503 domain-containing protein [Candidatus Dormibacteraeota bacterium]